MSENRVYGVRFIVTDGARSYVVDTGYEYVDFGEAVAEAEETVATAKVTEHLDDDVFRVWQKRAVMCYEVYPKREARR